MVTVGELTRGYPLVMDTQGSNKPSSSLGIRVQRAMPEHIALSDWPATGRLRDVVRTGLPARGTSENVNRWRLKNQPNLARGLRRVVAARALGIPTHYGALFIDVVKADGAHEPYGLASLRVVTTAGAGAIVDAFQNTFELENFKFHGVGTGSTAESPSDTALVTESTTALNPDNTRATGSTTEGATPNIYRTVGTVAVDAAVAAVEHGVFSQAATGGGVMLDRSVFSVVNLASGDSIQFTYELTFTAGG